MGSSRTSAAGSKMTASAGVVAVCVSPGGVPKLPVPNAELTPTGLVGDGHDHEKHRRLHRAVSIQDLELLEELKAEGYPVAPGTIGENLTVRRLHVQALSPGDRLRFEDGPVLELTEPRKPCFVLDRIHPMLKDAVAGRCGFLAKVIKAGQLAAGQRVFVEKMRSVSESA